MRGDVQNQLKISAPHPITETYRFIPLLAALISLDSPFNFNEQSLYILILSELKVTINFWVFVYERT
jgi:hypothetical protein